MTKAAPRTPTKGRVKQHLARRSLDGERGQALPSHVQEPESSGWSFSRKQFLTLTRHSVVGHGALSTAAVINSILLALCSAPLCS